jgi:3-(3-hydroxy-phenyl)propionate hydroxylase
VSSPATVIELAIGMGQMVCACDPDEVRGRDEMFLAAYDGSVTEIPPFPGVSAGIVLAGSPKAGDLFLQADVERAGVRTPFDDAVGAGWRLVTNDPVALDRELADWFASIGGAVVAVGGSAELGDADGAYGTWFTEHGVTAALQRPDFVLFGTAVDATQTGELVRSLRDALQPT